MSKQAEADLILKLYDLRREATMRKAREWYFRQFHPESAADIKDALLGENSAYLRMVVTYWDMAAGLVNYGSISPELFNDTTGEHIGVFSKIEPFLNEARGIFGPQLPPDKEEDTCNGGDGEINDIPGIEPVFRLSPFQHGL